MQSISVKVEQRGFEPRLIFSKADRLLRRSDFLRLSKNGKRYQNRYFLLYVCKNDLNRNRLGITVTRKVGTAVVRNRIKRLAREYFRQKKRVLSANRDILLIAKKEAAGISNKRILLSLEDIFAKIEAATH